MRQKLSYFIHSKSLILTCNTVNIWDVLRIEPTKRAAAQAEETVVFAMIVMEWDTVCVPQNVILVSSLARTVSVNTYRSPTNCYPSANL